MSDNIYLSDTLVPSECTNWFSEVNIHMRQVYMYARR